MDDLTKTAGTEAEKLRDYLAQDLAVSKIQLNESKRNTSRLVILSIILSVLIAVCVLGFAATIYFITKEQTAQIQAIFNRNWTQELERDSAHVEQNSGDGNYNNNAVVNNGSSITGSTISAGIPTK